MDFVSKNNSDYVTWLNNIKENIKQFFEFYSKYTIVQPPVGQLQTDANQYFPTNTRQLTYRKLKLNKINN
jgi:hypothetical protein